MGYCFVDGFQAVQEGQVIRAGPEGGIPARNYKKSNSTLKITFSARCDFSFRFNYVEYKNGTDGSSAVGYGE